MRKPILLDCTLRDGGYYNDWDFSEDLILDYLKAMSALSVGMIEFGFRTFPGSGHKFNGCCAYSKDSFIKNIDLPDDCPPLAVMVNGADLVSHGETPETSIKKLFVPAKESPVRMVRIACHIPQIEALLPAVSQLKEMGYQTTVNIMQIAGIESNRLKQITRKCSQYPVDVLYFADTFGSMSAKDVEETVSVIKEDWQGELGMHAHNNMEKALPNTLKALELGVNWVDATVTGMGRGPGNVCTEYLALEMESRYGIQANYSPLLKLIEKYFEPMKNHYHWGPNFYYFLAGKYKIHPSYIQEMSGDPRFDSQDKLAVVNHLKSGGGKQYNISIMENARNFYHGDPVGTWEPETWLKGKDVLLIGAGPSVSSHKKGLEVFIQSTKPVVLAMNTKKGLPENLIDARVACHPLRLLADCEEYRQLSQPLIMPYSMLAGSVQKILSEKVIFDFGLGIKKNTFEFGKNVCTVPNALVVAYSLAIAASGQAGRILLAGFDGFGTDDPRSQEMEELFRDFQTARPELPVVSITPTQYKLPVFSLYSV